MCVQTNYHSCTQQFVWALLTFSTHLLRETNLCIITVLPLNVPTHSNTHTVSPCIYLHTLAHIQCQHLHTQSHLRCNSMNNHHLNVMRISLHLLYTIQIAHTVFAPSIVETDIGAYIIKVNWIFFDVNRNPEEWKCCVIQITLSVTIKP